MGHVKHQIPPTFRQLFPAAELTNTSSGESQAPPECDSGNLKSSFHSLLLRIAGLAS